MLGTDMPNTVIREDVADEFIWSTIEITRNAEGAITDRTTTFDDGRVRNETFEEGVRISLLWTDENDVKSWESQTLTYDTNGQLLSRSTVGDDGVLRDDHYQDGVRTRTEQSDPADTKSWGSIQTFYDADGAFAYQFRYDDSGVEWTTYATPDGGRSIGLWDRFDAFEWESKARVKDSEGNTVFRNRFDDNDDATVWIHSLDEDPDLDIILRKDGDGSDPWLATATFYDDAGRVDYVETYMTRGDVPDEYASALDLLAFAF